MPRDPFRLVFNRGELDDLLNSTDGPVARSVALRAQRTAGAARRRAPRRTGQLKKSIGWYIDRDDEGVYADVYSTTDYAVPLHQGHKQDNGGRRVRARPFLRGALYAGRSRSKK